MQGRDEKLINLHIELHNGEGETFKWHRFLVTWQLQAPSIINIGLTNQCSLLM